MSNPVWAFTVYTNETDLLTDEQRDSFDYEPLTTILVPEDIARSFFEESGARDEVAEELGIPAEQATFEQWHNEVYTADSTVGLWSYAIAHGVTPAEG